MRQYYYAMLRVECEKVLIANNFNICYMYVYLTAYYLISIFPDIK